MRKGLFGTTALVILSSCSPPDIFYKQGVTNAQVDTDQNACQVQATNEVPPNIQTRYIPPVYSYQPVCNGDYCYNRQILVQPGRWEQYDANAGLRASVADQCMLSKGYGQVSLPRCDETVLSNTQVASNLPAPPISKQSCAVKTTNGDWRVVTP
ncbi:hypothetical protein ROA7450_01765 [Roseovarius albus]|uniref:Lipoprotein n=2 Tax=Roseovarius albus TaxID=1247867 RepID=A0A1X6Z184_9RHOB|nr:hypothetical protein ROA7450_01765 [Roseovarius albus]